MSANSPNQGLAGPRLNTLWREFAGGVAVPTVALAVVNIAVIAVVWVLSLRGVISLATGSMVATVNAYLVYTVLHEAAHGNIDGGDRRFARLQKALGWISSTLLMFPYPAFRAIHLAHHAHANDPENDPDYWVAGNNMASVLFRCMTLSVVYHAWMLRSESRVLREARPAYIAGMFLVGTLLAATWLAGFFWHALALWVFPAFLTGTLLALLFDWLPHHPHSDQGRRSNSRILLHPMITVPLMWQNYHQVHHVFPRVPFFRYARCFDALRPEFESSGRVYDARRTTGDDCLTNRSGGFSPCS